MSTPATTGAPTAAPTATTTAAATTTTPAAPLPPDWNEAKAPDGRTYFWNTRTRETSWERPVLLGQDNAEERLRRVRADHAVILEHHLATLGWTAKYAPKEMVQASVDPYAKLCALSTDEAQTHALAERARASLALEVKEVEALAKTAKERLEQAQALFKAQRTNTSVITIEESRTLLHDFIVSQTSVHKDKDTSLRNQTIKAKAHKKQFERELADMMRHSEEGAAAAAAAAAINGRPRREVKSRLVEGERGYMILRENSYTLEEGMPTISSQQQQLQLKKAASTTTTSGPGGDSAAAPASSAANDDEEGDPTAATPSRTASVTPTARREARRQPKSAFAFYNKETVAQLKLENPNLDAGQAQRIVADMWKVTPEADRARWHAMAEEDRLLWEKEKQEEYAAIEADLRSGAGSRSGARGAGTPGGGGFTPSGGASNAMGMATTTNMSTSGGLVFPGGIPPPTPDMQQVIECALVAMGIMCGCSYADLLEWFQKSPLGIRLANRVKGTIDANHIRSFCDRRIKRGFFVGNSANIKLSRAGLNEFIACEPLARIKRHRAARKLVQPLSTANGGGGVVGPDAEGVVAAAASAANGAAPPLNPRQRRNDVIKNAVVDAAVFRWAYLLRHRSAIEPFCSPVTLKKFDQANDLLRASQLDFLLDPPDLDSGTRLTEDQYREIMSKALVQFPNHVHPFVSAPRASLPAPATITGGQVRPYQLRGLGWMVHMFESGVNAVLADEMGLGKTLQTICFLAHLKETVGGPFLVVVPLSVLTNWCNELKKWCPSMRVIKLHSSNREERDRVKRELMQGDDDFDVVVTTYEMITSQNMKVVLTSRIWWRCMVVDEGHKIKNDSTGLSQTVRSINSQYRLLLTGTPLQNNLHELWAMLNFLDPVVFDSSDKFDSCFDLSKNVVDASMLEKAHYLLKPFCLRRTKDEVEANLPPKEEIEVRVGLSEMQRFWYKRLILQDADLLERVEQAVAAATSQGPNGTYEDSGGGGSGANDYKRLQSLIMQLRKACNHPFLFSGAEPDFDGSTSEDIVEASGKMRMLDRLLQKLQQKGHRVVIFSQFTSMLDILSDFLRLRGYKHCRLDGSTNRVQRAVDILQYNQGNSEYFAFLMSTRAGGLGINLFTADTVILYDSDWNPQVDMQAMDRVHRIGQTKPVHVYRLLAPGTVEERIVQRAKKKLYLDRMVNRGSTAQSEALEGLTKSEMLKMLKFGASAVFGSGAAGGSPAGELTDEQLDKLIDRSPEAARERSSGAAVPAAADAAAAPAVTVVAPVEMNALEFDPSDMPDVPLRELYGTEFGSASSVAPAPPRPASRTTNTSVTVVPSSTPVHNATSGAASGSSKKKAASAAGGGGKRRRVASASPPASSAATNSDVMEVVGGMDTDDVMNAEIVELEEDEEEDEEEVNKTRSIAEAWRAEQARKRGVVVPTGGPSSLSSSKKRKATTTGGAGSKASSPEPPAPPPSMSASAAAAQAAGNGSGGEAPPQRDASKRQVKTRLVEVDGHAVLRSNNYSLEEGEQSVFKRELGGRKKRGPADRAELDELNRSLGRGRQMADRDFINESHCLRCWDGGELMLCDQCPVSVHPECLAEGQDTLTALGTWGCPHHSCKECGRKSDAVGGMLFRCTECLNAYCEDHLPQGDNMKLGDEGRSPRFEELGFRKPAQAYYIQCSKNCQQFMKDRTTLGVERAIELAVKRLEAAGGDAAVSSSSS